MGFLIKDAMFLIIIKNAAVRKSIAGGNVLKKRVNCKNMEILLYNCFTLGWRKIHSEGSDIFSILKRGYPVFRFKFAYIMRNGVVSDRIGNIEDRKIFVFEQIEGIFETDIADEIDERLVGVFFEKHTELRVRIIRDFDDFGNMFAEDSRLLQLRKNL